HSNPLNLDAFSFFFKCTTTYWRLCEVFCILQNLLMCEVPERASDGKASSAIWREPEGISPDRSFRGYAPGGAFTRNCSFENAHFSYPLSINRRRFPAWRIADVGNWLYSIFYVWQYIFF